MATSGGEIINSSSTPESESKELFCSPCQSDGNRLAAVGYCGTCKTYLCKLCFDCHTVPIPMRNHKLLKREQLLVGHEEIKDKTQCPDHEGEAVMYHCPTHSLLGCHTCFFQHQKTCREVKYIPELSETVTSSDEFKELMTKLVYAAKTSKDLVDEFKRNITSVKKCHTEAMAAIKAFKLELLEAIDQLENELYEKIELTKQKSISSWKYAVEKQLKLETELKTMASEMKVLQNKNRKNDLYIAMVKSKNRFLFLETELNAAKGRNLKPFNFQANTELHETLRSTSWLGKIRNTAEVVKVEHAKDINVKLVRDKSTCIISGSAVMSDYRLVIADSSNHKVKIFDTKQQKFLSSMVLSSRPWSLAKVTDNTVAATLPDEKKIVFIRINPALGIDTEIGVNGSCYGVAYNDGKLVVSFCTPYKVEIMDVKGSVLRTIQTDGNGQALFNGPYYVAINPECSLIYVSNGGTSNVVCLRFDGTVVATYEDNELQHPRQAIVDSTGNVYVCASGSKNVHQITDDCKKIKVILRNTNGLSKPYTISYDETEGKLHVGQAYTDKVNVYRMIYDSL